MVTFRLGGKDYGIDIMTVKEIYKASNFTYVPNTAVYVRGVFNLRGEIVSVIDLRTMFNVGVPEANDEELDDIIFLQLQEKIVGVIVDEISNVVGVSSDHIQPPHPLFGDINFKYISGVVEQGKSLYIILDAEAIFGGEATPDESAPAVTEALPDIRPREIKPQVQDRQLDLSFIAETLETFRSYHVSPINETWVKARFEEWKRLRGSDISTVQLKSPEDADEFLQGFFSPCTGALWTKDLQSRFAAMLEYWEGRIAEDDEGPDGLAATPALVSLWNVGCGQGQESYSLACILADRYPSRSIKIWAHDKDLLKVSMAPNAAFQPGEVPPEFQNFMVASGDMIRLNQEIRDSILFEYHDVLNDNPFPPVNFIVARDMLSYLASEQREKLLTDFAERLAPNGMILLGQNEKLPSPEWVAVDAGGLVGYMKGA